MRWTRFGSVYLCLGVLIVAALGCGSKEPMGQVSGKVTLQGNPLPGAEVEFQPVDNRPPSTGRTDAQGRYELQYSAQQRGAVAGEHVVRITTEQDPSDDGTPGTPEKLPPKYNVQSDLKRTVKPGRQTIDFEL